MMLVVLINLRMTSKSNAEDKIMINTRPLILLPQGQGRRIPDRQQTCGTLYETVHGIARSIQLYESDEDAKMAVTCLSVVSTAKLTLVSVWRSLATW